MVAEQDENETGLVPVVGGAMTVSTEMEAELAALAQTGEELGGTLLDMLGIYSADRDRWKQGETKKDRIVGIYLHSVPSLRSFWPPEAEMGGSPPVCWSMGGDGAVPHANSIDAQAAKCEGCPWDEFGTAKQGKGKGCKTKRADFFVEIDPTNLTRDDGGNLVVTGDDVVGVALIRASATAQKTRRSIGQWAKDVRQQAKGITQLVLTEWSFIEEPAGNGRPAFYPPVLNCLGKYTIDNDGLAEIVQMSKDLRGGEAEEVLATLAGKAPEEDEEGEG